MQMPIWLAVLLVVAALAAGIFAGYLYRKKVAEKEIGSAEDEAKRIINEAIKSAEAKKRESVVEAREEIFRARSENERECKERRAEVQKQERRIQQKEEALERKTESVEAKEEKLSQKLKALDEQKAELETLKNSQLEMLEKISGLTVEEAKTQLISQVETEAKHDAVAKLKEIERQLKDEADSRAREIISTAIQRCAADHASEATVSVVPLPNDEMKGRIIGREGRNIRTLETLTGVDLIIDDTPEAITLSSFDPVRREIARLSLEKLITDGRIHPARIEETVEKAQREVEAVIKQEGERAIFETGVHGVHQELIKLLGRMRYRTSYGQNVLAHSIEVSHIAGLLAAELGLPAQQVNLAKRAGLLHDIGKVPDEEPELPHALYGAKLAEKYKEKADICNAIGAHHDEMEMTTLLAPIVQVCDAISGARPGARREIVEAYIKRLKDLENIAMSYPGVVKTYAIQAGRELRVIVGADKIDDKQTEELSNEIATKIQNEMTYPGQVKITVIRETRSVSYAK